MLPLDGIRIDGGTQPRAALDQMAVEEYAEAIARGESFPPVVAFYDGRDYWLADGFHRYNAFKKLCVEEVEVDVRQGTREDAVWFSCSANRAHGLPRSNRDKRRAVETALRLRPDASDRAIAEHVGVSPTFVATVRAETAPRQVSTVDTSKRKGKDGKSYPAPKPKAEPPRTRAEERRREQERPAPRAYAEAAFPPTTVATNPPPLSDEFIRARRAVGDLTDAEWADLCAEETKRRRSAA